MKIAKRIVIIRRRRRKKFEIEFEKSSRVNSGVKLKIFWKNHEIQVWDTKSVESPDPHTGKATVYKHKITIYYNDEVYHFDYYGGIKEYEEGIDSYVDYRLIDVFETILRDALIYKTSENIYEFARDMKIYDAEKAYERWIECKRTYLKLKKLLQMSDDELFELAEDLVEYLHDL